MVDPRKFWEDPDSFRGQVDDSYIEFCLPEYYFAHHHLSERIVEAMTDHVGLMPSIWNEWKIVELGCSVGRNLLALGREGFRNLSGVEINPKAALYARERGVQVFNMSIQDYLSAHTADVFFTQSVLMHIPPEDEYIFEKMAEAKMVITHEVEATGGIGKEFKWSRNYQKVFEGLGMKQVAMKDYGGQILRVFK